MTDTPEYSALNEGRWIVENRPELLGELVSKLVEDSEWLKDIDPTYFEDQNGTISVTELIDKVKKEEI